MRAYLPDYEMITAPSLQGALEVLARGEFRPFAGGTDLMVLFEAGKLSHHKWLSIWGLDELRGIRVEAAHIAMGALTTYSQIQRDATVQAEFPLLIEAARLTGAIAIQNRGTLGGNIVNASPAADSPPALLVYEAELELVSCVGGKIVSRWVSYRDFHTGYKSTLLKKGELLRTIRLPRTLGAEKGWVQHYRKVGTRKAQAISKICIAAAARVEGAKITDARIALGSVAPVPMRCLKTEAYLRGKDLGLAASWMGEARAVIASEISPIDDIRSNADYRRGVTQNLLEEFVKKLSSGSTR